MDERADFVKKIENELRKPKADQNQDLLAFWNGQLNSLNAAEREYGLEKLFNNGLPSQYQHNLSESTAHIQTDLPDVVFEEKVFGLIGDTVHTLLRDLRQDSGFYGAMLHKDIIEYSSVHDIEGHVGNYFTDVVKGMGIADGVRIYKGIEVLRLCPDIWLLTVNFLPFLIVEVKKPIPGILSEPKVLSQLARYMQVNRNYYGLVHVFGIVTTLEEWRVCWLPDCDEYAARTDDVPAIQEDSTLFIETVNLIHCTSILRGNDRGIHHYIATVVRKALSGVTHRIPLELSSRLIFQVDKEHLTWSSLKLGTSISLAPPYSSAGTFYLIRDLHHGADGRVWLAVSRPSTSSAGCICTLKFPKRSITKRSKRKLDVEAVQNEALRVNDIETECGLWQALEFKSQCISLVSNPCLQMPWAITLTIRAGADSPARWDTTCWDLTSLNLFSALVPPAEKTLVEETLINYTPHKALTEAVNFVIQHRVWHKDIKWRHVALVITTKRSWYFGSPKVLIQPCLIDWGRAEKFTRATSQIAMEDMKAKRDALLSNCPEL